MAKFRIHKSRNRKEWYVCRLDTNGACRYTTKEFKTGNAAIREFDARGRNGA